MKKYKNCFLLQGLLILSVFFLSCTVREEKYALYDTDTGEKISLNGMSLLLAAYDIVLFGEYHGNETIHSLQAGLLPLYSNQVKEFAISMEMFERDVQDVLNRFLAGEIVEDDFLKESRAWSNYKNDYKPIIDFAGSKGIDVIAANVPRRYAAELSRNGLSFLETVPEEEREYLAEEVILTEDAYRDKFNEVMSVTPHLSSAEEEDFKRMLKNIYAAQSLKDDTMAESIYNYRRAFPGRKIIHFTGDFHIRDRLGIYTKLKLLEPDLRIAVISPLFLSADEKFVFSEEISNIADFIIVINETDI